MKTANSSASGSQIPKIPCRIIIDFYSRWLDRFSNEDIELILGQMIYGLINNSLFTQYGLLVTYFINSDDSAVDNELVKLKYVDEIFAECHQRIHSLENELSVFHGYDIEVCDVKYDKVAGNVSFLIERQRDHSGSGRLRDIHRVLSESRTSHGQILRRR